MNFSGARKLVDGWIAVNCPQDTVIDDSKTIVKPYGWVFFYQSKKYLKTEVFGEMLLGNAPILITRINGELIVFGTAQNVDYYISEYEKKLSKAVINLQPEPPGENI